MGEGVPLRLITRNPRQKRKVRTDKETDIKYINISKN